MKRAYEFLHVTYTLKCKKHYHMKKILSLAITVMAMTSYMALSGCSDFLDADNKSNGNSDEYFNTSDGFETLVNYAYASMKPLYNDDPAIYSSGTDLYQKGRNNMPDEGLQNYKDLNPEDGTVTDFYTNCYKGIQAANCVLHYAATTSAKADLVSLRTAEARFLRSFFYFELVQQFGGVPIVKEYVSTIITSIPRSSTQETYDFIFSELEDIVKDGSPLPATDKSGRVSKQCVYHYLAKAYLTAAWDLNNKDYFTTAANYAEKAIALGSGLDETFESLWLPANDNKHQETIFAIQYDRTSSTGAGIAEADNANSLQSWFGSYYGGQDQHYKYASSNYVVSEHFVNMFEKGDSRYEGTFMTKLYCTDVSKPLNFGDYYAPYKGNASKDYIAFYYPPHYACSAADIAAWRAVDPVHRTSTVVIPAASNTYRQDGKTPCTYFEAATLDVFGMTCIRKFDDPDASYGSKTCYRDIVLARLAETYLIASEAYLEASNQPKADAMLNVVRERAFRGSGVAYSKSGVTIDDILTERALEFAGERLRWTDLRRTKKLVEYNSLYNVEITSATTDPASYFVGPDGKQRLYRPIPQSAINLNNAKIEQNPGYSISASE